MTKITLGKCFFAKRLFRAAESFSKAEGAGGVTFHYLFVSWHKEGKTGEIDSKIFFTLRRDRCLW